MTRMEAGRSILGQTPPLPFPAPSRFKTTGVCTFPATPTRRSFPALVMSPEPRDEARPPLLKEDTSPEFMTSEEGSDAEDGDWLGPNFKQSGSLSSDNRMTLLGSSTSSSSLLDEVITVRSTKRLRRESVRRKVSIPSSDVDPYAAFNGKPRKNIYRYREVAPIQKFLWRRQSEELLTKTEEFKLAEDIQELLRLEEVKNNFELNFGRRPTLPEWAEYVGLSCNTLKHRLRIGFRSRKILINSNLRMVAHIAQHYQGNGLGLADLLQEGNVGLLKSVDRFKPQSDCRFATYSYYWIRQSIQIAIQRHSRIIYLPQHVHQLLKKVKAAKKSCISEGNYPTSEEIARRVGITPVVLMKLLDVTRLPSSLDRHVWCDGFVTYKDLVADPRTGDLFVSYAKQKMEQHLLELVKALPPKESRIIWLRYGLDNGRPKNLAEIGHIFGHTRERMRQLHNRGLEKIKESIPPEEKKAYVALLTGQL